jgi:hypothetical protein
VWGDYAYLTYNGPAGEDVRVVDISAPATPVLVGTLNTENPRGVTVVGDRAHVADGSTGLRIFDITNPTAATQLGVYDTPGSAEAVFVAGDHAFVADGDSGLVILDITNVASPVLVGLHVATDPARDVEVHGSHAFVARGALGLQVIDITDPSLPALAGSYNTSGNARRVTVEGNIAYVADESGGAHAIDIIDPSTPALASSYATSGNALDVFVDGDYAYVTDDVAGLITLDVSLPTSPVLVESFATAGTATGIIVDRNLAFVADAIGGLQVVQAAQEVLPPALVVPIMSLGTSISVNRIEVSGNYAYIANHNTYMIIVDISDPGNPFVVTNYSLGGGIGYDVRVSGDYAYLSKGTTGIEIVDVSDPTAPVSVGSLAVGDSPNGAFIDGDLLFVAGRNSGLHIVDVSNRAAPALLGTYDTPGSASDVVVLGDHAFVADASTTGLLIIDVTNPGSPTLVGSAATAGSPSKVTVNGDYAYLAEFSGGFEIADISNLAAPSVVTTITTTHWAYESFVSGDRLFLTKGQAGFEIYDITNPAAPTLVGGYDFGVANEQVNAVSVAGDFAFVARAATGAGLSVIRVSQRGVDRELNEARSLVVDGEAETILAARLTTTPPAISATWEMSSDSGSTWDEVAVGNTWKAFTSPGADLMWRTTFDQTGGFTTVAQLDIEWLNERSTIFSAVDIPGDEGKQLRVSWTPSGYDLPGSPLPIHNYAVYRRIDDTPALVAVRDQGTTPATGPYDAEELMQALPPGSWEYLTLVPAAGTDQYSTVVPTAADSTIANGLYYSVFFVRALTATPGIHYDSAPDSGYSVDNLAPAAPTGFSIAQSPPSGNQLGWDSPVSEDFDYFRIYRNTEPGFDPTPGDMVHATSDVQWLDPIDPGWQYHYKITAVDYSGNESEHTGPSTVTGVPSAVPTRFALHQNTPNPFNPTTLIRYDVPGSGGHVTLRIYDVTGRLVRTLVDGPHTAGEKRVIWYGQDNWGNHVATGVYFYRMTTPGFTTTKKMVLLR